MDYKERWKKRKIKNALIKTINTLKFKSLNLSISGKISLFWSWILLFSLFQPWLINTESSRTWNSFTSLAWNMGFILILLFFILVFFILSTNNKEKLKLHSNISFKNYYIIIVGWLFIIISWLISLSFINWLLFFFQDIIYWRGIILCISSWIIILFWWYLTMKESKNYKLETFVNEYWETEIKITAKNNMKLPF